MRMNRLARALRTLVVAAWAVVVAPSLHAQTVTLAPSEALNCLTPDAARRSQIEFPFGVWKEGKGGRVKVQAVFVEPDAPPSIQVLGHEGDEALVDAVKAAVRQWRVPCLSAGERATLQQEVVFNSSLGKFFVPPVRDAAEVLKQEALKCLAYPAGERTPAYPMAALRYETQGFVLARATFSAPDRAPQVEVSARPGAQVLARAVEGWLKGVRMPCLTGERISTYMTFKFRLDGNDFGLKPTTLQRLLPAVKGIRSTPLQLDTSAMGCPFNVQWQYMRPFAPNGIYLMEADPATALEREPLFAWLRQVELDLPGATMDAVFGDTTTLTVPCLKINLNPKEKS
jgi:hypothetical protein